MSSDSKPQVQVIDSRVNHKKLALIKGKGTALVVLWPGNRARFRTMQILQMEAGDETIDLRHPHDCVYYVSNGAGRVRDLSSGAAQDLIEGSIVHIDARDDYRIEAGADGMRMVGGPVPADPELYASLAAELAQ